MAVQGRMGLLFSAAELKAVLGYTYMNQMDEPGIEAFVRAAYEMAGKALPAGTE